jgi:hypothetical protein
VTRPAADDPERDAWLSEALRHAPDAQRGPPEELSASILREARMAVRAPHADTPLAPRARGRRATAWAWLGRPPVAAGFASVMVAVLVGLLWWDRPLDDGLRAPGGAGHEPSRDAVPAAESEAARQAAPSPAAEPAPAPEPATPNRSARASRASDAAAPRAPGQPERRSESAGAAAPADRLHDERIAPPAPFAETAPTVETPRRGAAPTASPDRTIEAEVERRNPASSEAVAANRGALSAEGAKALVPRATPLAALLSSIDAEPQRWTGRRDGGVRQAASAGLAGWLHRLDRVTAGRWRSGPAVGGGVDADHDASSTLELYRDGAPAYVLHLDAAGARLTAASPGATPQQVELASGLADELRRELVATAP